MKRTREAADKARGRRATKTAVTTAGQDAPSSLRGAEWNLLSGLPDLALAHLISFLAPSTLLEGDQEGLSELHRSRVLHAEYKKAQLKDGDDAVEDEDERKGEDEKELPWNDQPNGQKSARDVLALRLTSRSVMHAVDCVICLPMHVLWKFEQLLANEENRDTEQTNPQRKIWDTVTERASARLHQLRLQELVGYVWRQWQLDPAKLEALNGVLALSHPPPPQEGQAHLRIESFTFDSGFFGELAGLYIDSSLSLTLPGQPEEKVILELVVESAEENDDFILVQDVDMVLHTSSKAWMKKLGLEPPHQRRMAKLKKATGATNKKVHEYACTWVLSCIPDIRCGCNEPVVLGLLDAIGLHAETKTTEEAKKKKKEAKKTKKSRKSEWTLREAEILLLSLLGLVWKNDVIVALGGDPDKEGDDDAEGDKVNGGGSRKCEIDEVVDQARLRRQRHGRPQAESRRQADAYIEANIEDQNYHQASRLVQQRTWQFVERAAARFCAQRRFAALMSPALDAINAQVDQPGTWCERAYRPAHADKELLSQFKFISGAESSMAPESVDGTDSSISFKQTTVRFFVRVPPLSKSGQASTDDGLLFFFDHRSGYRGAEMNHLAVRVIGHALGQQLALDADHIHTLWHSELHYDMCQEEDLPLEVQRVEVLKRVGEVVGMRFSTPTPCQTKLIIKRNADLAKRQAKAKARSGHEDEDEDDEDEEEEEEEEMDEDSADSSEGKRRIKLTEEEEEHEFGMQVASLLVWLARLFVESSEDVVILNQNIIMWPDSYVN